MHISYNVQGVKYDTIRIFNNFAYRQFLLIS